MMFLIVYVYAYLLSAALRLCGIDRNTVAPSGGEIDRDAEGNITGILRESAIQLCTNLQKESKALAKRYITSGLQWCLKVITIYTVLFTRPFLCMFNYDKLVLLRADVDASYIQNGLTCVQPNDTRTWHLYKELFDEGSIPIRVFLTINQDEIYDKQAIEKGMVPKAKETYGTDHMLSCHRVKFTYQMSCPCCR